MRLFRRDLKTRNSGLALLSMCSIITLAYVWYLGGLGPNLTPKEVLMQQVFSEHLPLHLHQGPKAAQSIVPVTVQHSKMPPRSKHPDTSPVPLLAATPLSAQSAKLCGTRRRDPANPPRVLRPVSPRGILLSWARACVFL